MSAQKKTQLTRTEWKAVKMTLAVCCKMQRTSARHNGYIPEIYFEGLHVGVDLMVKNLNFARKLHRRDAILRRVLNKIK